MIDLAACLDELAEIFEETRRVMAPDVLRRAAIEMRRLRSLQAVEAFVSGECGVHVFESEDDAREWVKTRHDWSWMSLKSKAWTVHRRSQEIGS